MGVNTKEKITQAQAIIISAIVTTVLGGLIGGYFAIQSAIKPIELSVSYTQTAETKATSSPAPTVDVLATNTPSFTPIATLTPTSLPTILPTLSPGQDWTENCISNKIWTPHVSYDLQTVDSCWNLQDYGFIIDNGNLIMFAQDSEDVYFYAIYTTIEDTNVEINFSVSIEDLSTIDADSAVFIEFGITGVNDNLYPSDSLYFYKKKANDDLNITTGNLWRFVPPDFDHMEANQYYKSGPVKVNISIKGKEMRTYVGGREVLNPKILTSNNPRIFFIGYSLPAHSNLRVVISNFSIIRIQ